MFLRNIGLHNFQIKDFKKCINLIDYYFKIFNRILDEIYQDLFALESILLQNNCFVGNYYLVIFFYHLYFLPRLLKVRFCLFFIFFLFTHLSNIPWTRKNICLSFQVIFNFDLLI